MLTQFPIPPPPPPPDYNIQRIADAVTNLASHLSPLSGLAFTMQALLDGIQQENSMWRIRAEEWEREARELKEELTATKGEHATLPRTDAEPGGPS